MTCKHCGAPIERCSRQHGLGCQGWAHSHTGFHGCSDLYAEPEPDTTEPEPGQPARMVHLIRPDLTLACGHQGRDHSSSVTTEVTCGACKAVA